MNALSFNTNTSARITSLLLSSVLALGLVACGSSAGPSEESGESEQPITAGDTPDEAPAGDADACALGTPIDGPFGEDCQVIASGRCFTTAEAACACGGCGVETCAIAESFPAQAFCQNDDGDPGSDPDGNVSDTPDGGGSSSSPGYPGSGVSGSPGCDPGQTDPAPPIPAGCDFVVNGACFDDGVEACRAAGCAENECIILESYPAQVGCGS